jgi:hypothetical protein
MLVLSIGQIAAESGYQIVHEAAFDEQLAEATGSIFRGDEFIRDVEWVLARNPNSGYPVAENLWCFERREGGSDLLLIVYMFNEAKKEVHLLSIRRSAGDVAAHTTRDSSPLKCGRNRGW